MLLRMGDSSDAVADSCLVTTACAAEKPMINKLGRQAAMAAMVVAVSEAMKNITAHNRLHST